MDFLKDRQICFHWFFKRFISLIVYSYHNPHKKWFIVLIFFYLIEINLCRCTNCLCPPNEVVFAPFLIIITSPRLLLGDVLLFCVSFSLLLLRLPDCCRVTYCYSMFLFHYYYYVSPSNEGRHIVLVWFFLLPLLLLLSVSCPDHNFFVFPYRSIIFGMWVHDHKAVCRVP